MDLLKAAPEAIADYLSFLVAFTIRPKVTTTSRLYPNGVELDRIDGKLALYCVLGVGLAIAIGHVGTAIGMANDNSDILKTFRKIGDTALPLVALVAIFFASAVAHAAGWLSLLAFGKLYKWPPMRSVFSSVNAGLAFASWYIPLVSLCFVALRLHIGDSPVPVPLRLTYIVYILPASLAFPVYGLASFSAAHGMSAGHLSSIFAGLWVVAFLVGQVAARL